MTCNRADACSGREVDDNGVVEADGDDVSAVQLVENRQVGADVDGESDCTGRLDGDHPAHPVDVVDLAGYRGDLLE